MQTCLIDHDSTRPRRIKPLPRNLTVSQSGAQDPLEYTGAQCAMRGKAYEGQLSNHKTMETCREKGSPPMRKRSSKLDEYRCLN